MRTQLSASQGEEFGFEPRYRYQIRNLEHPARDREWLGFEYPATAILSIHKTALMAGFGVAVGTPGYTAVRGDTVGQSASSFAGPEKPGGTPEIRSLGGPRLHACTTHFTELEDRRAASVARRVRAAAGADLSRLTTSREHIPIAEAILRFWGDLRSGTPGVSVRIRRN